MAARFGLVICPFNSFLHLLAVEQQLSCLACVHHHLAPGGRFAFDVFDPDVRRMTSPAFTDESLPQGFELSDGARVELRHRNKSVDFSTRYWTARSPCTSHTRMGTRSASFIPSCSGFCSGMKLNTSWPVVALRSKPCTAASREARMGQPTRLRWYSLPGNGRLLSTTVADSGQGVGVGVGSGSGGPWLGGVVSSATRTGSFWAIPWAARSIWTTTGAPREP